MRILSWMMKFDFGETDKADGLDGELSPRECGFGSGRFHRGLLTLTTNP